MHRPAKLPRTVVGSTCLLPKYLYEHWYTHGLAQRGLLVDKPNDDQLQDSVSPGWGSLNAEILQIGHDFFVIPQCRGNPAARSSVRSVCSNRPGRQF